MWPVIWHWSSESSSDVLLNNLSNVIWLKLERNQTAVPSLFYGLAFVISIFNNTFGIWSAEKQLPNSLGKKYWKNCINCREYQRWKPGKLLIHLCLWMRLDITWQKLLWERNVIGQRAIINVPSQKGANITILLM